MSAIGGKPHIRILDSVLELEQAAAELITEIASRAIAGRGRCTLILSGGETPRGVYRRLGSDPYRSRVAWDRITLLFADERLVPADDPLSTFGMLRTELLSRIPGVHVVAVNGELDPAEAAKKYQHDLDPFLHTPGSFDLALLGIGEDGHTASLFPAGSAPPEWSLPIVAVPGPRAWRVTMTPSVLNAARAVVFLVSGDRKAAIVRNVLERKEPTAALPASLIRPDNGTVTWMLDRAAAAALPAQNIRSGS